MARFDPDSVGIRAWARSDAVRDGLQGFAEPIRTEAERLTRAEAFDTGRMANSWKTETNLAAESWTVRVFNTARSNEGYPYALAVEFGYRARNGRHVEGQRILGRALGVNRI